MKKPSTLALTVLALMFSFSAYSIPKLNSLPSSQYVIFLDFDGHYVSSSVWNNGNPFTCAPSGLTDAQITEVFNRTAEDFRPFNVNITTDSVKFFAAQDTNRIRVIITPTSAWYPGVGGVSYTGSFTWGDGTPAFVFTDKLPVGGPVSPKMIGECCSHESGHTLGLSHQSKYDVSCGIIEYYSSGTGAGETGWSPVMGNSYYRNMTGWNDGPTQFGCAATQDNLSTITTTNGFYFTYRADDYTETMNASTTLLSGGSFSKSGIIERTNDKDAFRIVLAINSNVHIDATPYNVGANDDGANLDIKLQLFNNSGTLIKTYDPSTTMNVVVDTILNAGTYYFKVDGTGNANVSEYGSLGSYTLSGTYGALPIRDVELTGTTDKGKHNLNWNIIADEPIRSIVVQSSADGISFKTVTTVAGTAKNFSYQPFENSTLYYRLKVTSVIDQTVYSNVVVLRGAGKTEKLFGVSTIVQNEIVVNAAENYQYKISDVNGRPILSGNAAKGVSKITINNQPKGLYIISLISNNQIQTERIIKQ